MNKFLFLLIFMTALTAHSQEIKSNVDVTGKGSVMIVPDRATVRVRVEHQGSDAVTIKRQNDQVVSQVLLFLENNGIDSKDVMTDFIRLDKSYDIF